MKQLRSTGLLMLVVASMTGGAFAQEPNGAPSEPENDRWIVQFEGAPSENEIDALISYTGGQTVKRLHLINGRAVRGPESMVATLRTSILVMRVEKDVIRRATAQPSKPAPGEAIPWGVRRIDAEKAWGTSTGSGVKVAVLDTGISLSHPDLKNNIPPLKDISKNCSYNAIDPSKAPEDQNGHGSHVAGTIAAVRNNGIGVVGVAPEATLCAVQVLNAAGFGYCSDIIDGLSWVINKDPLTGECNPRAKVINMSYGGADLCTSEGELLDQAHDCARITLVAAAGNNSGGAVDYPAAYVNVKMLQPVIAVTAIDCKDKFAFFSSQGEQVDLTAPGVAIPSTYKRGGYKTLSGTSMAAPHVSGVAALVLKKNPNLTPDQVKTYLQNTAVNLGLDIKQQGAGLVNAGNADAVIPTCP
ncbi:MAG: S8 family peptidase [Sulfuricella sp.]|nr:S8 family peptidase [Sulfuricella sp.]